MSYLANKLLSASSPRFAFDQAYLRHWLPMTKTGLADVYTDLKFGMSANFLADNELTGISAPASAPWTADHPRYAADGAMSRHRAVRDTGSLTHEVIAVTTLSASDGVHIPSPASNGGVTFAIWMKPTEHIADHDILFCQEGFADFYPYDPTTPRAKGWGITIGELGKVAVHWGNGVANNFETHTYNTTADFTVGAWHRIVVTIHNNGNSSYSTEVFIDKKPQVRESVNGSWPSASYSTTSQTPRACSMMAGTWADMMIWTSEMTQKEVNADYSYDFDTPFVNYMNDLYHYSAVPMAEFAPSTTSTKYVSPTEDLNWYSARNIRLLSANDVVLGLVEPTVAALPYMATPSDMVGYFYEDPNWYDFMDTGGTWMFIRADSSNAGSETYLYNYDRSGDYIRIKLAADGKIKIQFRGEKSTTPDNKGYREMESQTHTLPYNQDLLVAFWSDGTEWRFYIEGIGLVDLVETINTVTSGTGITGADWIARVRGGGKAAWMMKAVAGAVERNRTAGRIYGTGTSDRLWNTPWLDGLGTSIREGSVPYKPFNHNILS